MSQKGLTPDSAGRNHSGDFGTKNEPGSAVCKTSTVSMILWLLFRIWGLRDKGGREDRGWGKMEGSPMRDRYGSTATRKQ